MIHTLIALAAAASPAHVHTPLPHTPVDMEIVAACGDTSRHVPKRPRLVLAYLERAK